MSNLPKARNHNLVTQQLNKELLLYDLNTNQVFCLNDTAAGVWNNCDGKTSISEIGSKQQLPVEIVLLTLEKLKRKSLLENGFEAKLLTDKLSRRRVISLAARAAIALPVISNIIAPPAIAAQSGRVCVPDGGVFDVSPQPDQDTCFGVLGEAENNGTGCCNKSTTFFFSQIRDNDCFARCPSLPAIVVRPPT